MSNIALTFDNSPVTFTSDAYINATEIAKHFNKVPKDYLRLEQTKEYIHELTKGLNLPLTKDQLVIVKKGGKSGASGTWLHPRLTIDFARWLSAKFSIWCDMQVEKILHPIEQPTQITITEREAHQFKKAMEGFCKGDGAKYSQTYRKVYDYYGVTSYKNIPAGKLQEAIRFLHGQLLPADDLKFLPVINPYEPMLPTTSKATYVALARACNIRHWARKNYCSSMIDDLELIEDCIAYYDKQMSEMAVLSSKYAAK